MCNKMDRVRFLTQSPCLNPNSPQFDDIIDSPILESSKCKMSEHEKALFIQFFIGWTGYEYTDQTENEMLVELLKIKKFLRDDLTKILGLYGKMAKINNALTIDDLNEFDEIDLLNYIKIFHFDVSALKSKDDKLNRKISSLSMLDDITEEKVLEISENNDREFLMTMKQLVLQSKFKVLEKLRLWRWREEVLLDRAGEVLDEYPGLMHSFVPETSLELFENGIESYYSRIGEITRELLSEKYSYFDVYHMCGLLSFGINDDVKFTTEMEFRDLIDLLLIIIDKASINPRHLLTPLGVRVIHNREESEILYNLNHHKNGEISRDSIEISCDHAGIECTIITEIENEDNEIISKRSHKPLYVLIEELTSQYMSPQFYSVIEQHRNPLNAINRLKTVDGIEIALGISDVNIDLIFYGIGDGFSKYQPFTVKNLTNTFSEHNDFFNPWSVYEFPENPHLWHRFSHQNMNRFLNVVLPELRKKTLHESDLDELTNVIISILDKPEIPNSKDIMKYLHPRSRQINNLTIIRDNYDKIGSRVSLFLAWLFNVGSQFSDWEDFTSIHSDSISLALAGNHKYKYVDPETTNSLVSKVFNMVAIESQAYFNIYDDEIDFNYKAMLGSLKLIKLYDGAYRIDWNDDLSTIHGHINRLIHANRLKLWEYVKTTGNWFMATAHYYSIIFNGVGITDTSITLDVSPEIKN